MPIENESESEDKSAERVSMSMSSETESVTIAGLPLRQLAALLAETYPQLSIKETPPPPAGPGPGARPGEVYVFASASVSASVSAPAPAPARREEGKDSREEKDSKEDKHESDADAAADAVAAVARLRAENAELSEQGGRAQRSMMAFRQHQQALFDEFVVLRQKYDGMKRALVSALWTHCAMHHPALAHIPAAEGPDFAETETQVSAELC
jgi:hypothetical protein